MPPASFSISSTALISTSAVSNKRGIVLRRGRYGLSQGLIPAAHLRRSFHQKGQDRLDGDDARFDGNSASHAPESNAGYINGADGNPFSVQKQNTDSTASGMNSISGDAVQNGAAVSPTGARSLEHADVGNTALGEPRRPGTNTGNAQLGHGDGSSFVAASRTPGSSGQDAQGVFASAGAGSAHSSASAAGSSNSQPDASDHGQDVKARKKPKTSLYGYAILAIFYAWAALWIWPMLVLHPFILLLDRQRRRLHSFVSFLWMRCAVWTCRFTPRVVNKENLLEPNRAVVYVANHSSYLDIFPLAFLRRSMKYVSKAEIFKLPIIGLAMQMTGMIGVRRMDRRGRVEAYKRMVTSLECGQSLVVFPEGTRSETGKMRKFQNGAFRAAKAAGAPIVPVTIVGTRDIMPSYAFVPLRRPTRKPAFSLVVHKAIESTDYEVDELVDRAFASVDSGLDPEIQTLPHD